MESRCLKLIENSLVGGRIPILSPTFFDHTRTSNKASIGGIPCSNYCIVLRNKHYSRPSYHCCNLCSDQNFGRLVSIPKTEHSSLGQNVHRASVGDISSEPSPVVRAVELWKFSTWPSWWGPTGVRLDPSSTPPLHLHALPWGRGEVDPLTKNGISKRMCPRPLFHDTWMMNFDDTWGQFCPIP